jgi:hypothetical protein
VELHVREPVSLREATPASRERRRHPRLTDPVVDDELGHDPNREQSLGLRRAVTLESPSDERRQR